MQPRFGIRTKLLLSILAILLVSYSTLLYSTTKTLSASVRGEIDKSLEANLKFARSQYFDRSEIVKYALLQSTVSQTLQQKMKERDGGWLSERLAAWHSVLPSLETMVVLDPDRRVLARLDSEERGDQVQVPALVDQALASGRTVVATEILSRDLLCRLGAGDYCAGKGRDSLAVTVAVPVLGPHGDVLGCILTADILNRQPNLPSPMRQIFGSDVEVSITQGGERIASSLPRSSAPASTLDPRVIELLQRGEGYRGAAEIGDRVYETAIEPLLNSKGEFVGSLSVAVSKESFKRIRRESLQNILTSAFLGILGSFALAFMASRTLTGPLRQLTAGVRRVTEGDLEQRVEGTYNDEVGILAEYFNSMSDALRERDRIINAKTADLQELNEQLEKKVVERTGALSTEMQRLEAVLTSMVEGVVVTDRANRVVLFNPAAQRLFELVPFQVVGQSIEQVCTMGGFESLIPRIHELNREIGSSGSKEDLEVKEKRLTCYLCSLADEGGEYAGLVISVRDVTVEQEVDRMKTEFISTVSHELKTPLTSMKGSLQLLLTRGKWLTDTERQLLTVCFRNTQRLIRLIGEILDISGIESGGMLFNFRAVSIGEVSVYAIEEIKSYAMGRDISIVNTIGEHLPQVYGDSDRLIQVLTNLLSNAVKFSPEGRVVTVSAEQDGNYLVVSVADRGTPIKPSERDKLFKKFQQIDNLERGRSQGTGLGLAICKEIVERHHGRIFYTAAKEQGNTFSFTVPVIGEEDGKG
ncbi:PAS domain-containing sensor histidine kinase [Geomonas silvestris]|uniref:histidine kinase n=1 Tax=Geomonas silvestris TaxID=2740184 RepID=A0A6V8MFM8_9BACT|nr:ATP-binding protein [Geomonas silvestris]GFO58796.1 PAS domain-containing sensor histidine kinase [Geomonas silvestris]